ncbi:MAG: hypothetical protein ABJA67_11975 [Chthonomonadales bacterium]
MRLFQSIQFARFSSARSLTVMAVAALTLGGSAALAQAPQALDIFPPGGTLASHVDAQLEGSVLLGASSVVISGTGVKVALGAPATDGNSVPLKVDIAADAAPGPYEVRVITPKGVSNPTYFWVGGYVPAVEVEPNDQPERATKLEKLPITVSGRMNAAEDVDWFSFHAEAGETFAIDIIANRLYSPMDAALELRDNENHILELAMEGYDRDPKMVHTFKKSGTYLVQVRDTMYRGGRNYVYRLSVGKVPYIQSIWPNGAKRGEGLNSKIEGANLGSVSSVTTMLPNDGTRGSVWIEPMVGGVASIPVQLSLTNYQQIVRGEAPGAPTVVSLTNQPMTLLGRLTKAKQIDSFVVAGTPGKPIRIQLQSHSIGSRMIPFITLTDAAGKAFQTTENEIGRDPVITLSPTAAANYHIDVSTIDGKFGPDFYYRLIIKPGGGNDFSISTTPDLINLGKGQTALVTVNVDRQDGYGGPIEVALSGVPAGISATPLTIPTGGTNGVFIVTAAPESNGISGILNIVGKALLVDGKPMERHARIIGTYARPGEGQPAPRTVAFQAVSASDAVGLFTLVFEPAMVTVAPGQTVMVKVKANRKAGDAGATPAINITTSNLPAGITTDAPVIPDKAGEILLKIIAAPTAPEGQGYLVIHGKLATTEVIAPALMVVIKK